MESITRSPFLWYRDKESLNLGGVCRYIVTYTNIDPNKNEIYYRLKNIERTSIRAIHLLNGPFILYCHVVPHRYNHRKYFQSTDPKHNKEVVFENQIKPGQTFNVPLSLNNNSYLKDSEEGYHMYQWKIDIVSQIVITTKTVILYDLMIGDDFKNMKKINHGSLQNSLTVVNKELTNSNNDNGFPLNVSTNPQLQVEKHNTKGLWATQPPYPDRPIHLIILTHGIFSNLTADMLYLKDSLESYVDENILVRGFDGNAGKSEKGVKKLGKRLSNYLINLIEKLELSNVNIEYISFIGHSLGGLVQLYAIKEILVTKGNDYFLKKNIQPKNLVCMASPLLGILSEMNIIIAWFLDLGTLGKTGRDLTLLKKIPNLKDISHKNDMHKRDTFRPLLEVLPDDPLESFLATFENLTLYANAMNDGIVPLRTSGLLYLDYEALGDVGELKKNKNKSILHDHELVETNTLNESIGEIPADKNDIKLSKNEQKRNRREKYKQLLSLNFNTGTRNNLEGKKFNRRQRNLLKINAKGSDLHTADYESGISDSLNISSKNQDSDLRQDQHSDAEPEDESGPPTLNLPPKASSIESAINTVLCPTPSHDFIILPEARNPVIFHDKYYHFDNLPEDPDEAKDKNTFKRKVLFNYNDWKLSKQTKIAKKYHTPSLIWRKVLVNLPPDAHNNIIVRRRFSNGFGWGVVDHLCKELFNSNIIESMNSIDNVSESGKNIKAKI